MAAVVQRSYRVNELTPDPAVVFDRKIGEQYLRYAHMLAARGLVYSSTGNLVMRVPHPNYPEGVCYVKCMGVSLEEMSMDDLVITYFISGVDGTTLPVFIYGMLRRGIKPEINAIATLMLLVSLTGATVGLLLRSRRA